MSDKETKFDEAFKTFLEGCNKIRNDHAERMGYDFVERDSLAVAKGGRKYLKIVEMKAGEISRVHCFVNATDGDVLKAAGFNAPAKHARGNIFDETNGLSKMGEYGPAYLR